MLPILLLSLMVSAIHGVRVREDSVSDEVQEQAVMQAGDLFIGRYELLTFLESNAWPNDIRGYNKISYLGKGAFGETWLAKDQKRQQNVALKFFYRSTGRPVLLNMQKANYQEKAALREAGKECDTPGKIMSTRRDEAGQARFAKCFENAVNDPKYSHLVLEVAGTQNLEEFVNAHPGGLSSAYTLRIAKMMLEGLRQMEGHFVHKDIKPANLMVYKDSEDHEVYLRFIDFGLVGKEGAQSGVAGTPMFLPPEMWPVVPYNPTIKHDFDIYSSGETLYSLICGKTFHEFIFDKFGHLSERDIASKLKTVSPSTYCHPRSSLEPLFSLVVNNMMAASPSQRKPASQLLGSDIFKHITTTKQVRQKPPQVGKPAAVKPAPVPVMVPEVKREEPVVPTFIEKCHANKQFWFANAVACCLKERFDPLRSDICARPCGPTVPYFKGKCQNECKVSSSRPMVFNTKLSCCVDTVWQTKCIYKDHMPQGEGWGWME